MRPLELLRARGRISEQTLAALCPARGAPTATPVPLQGAPTLGPAPTSAGPEDLYESVCKVHEGYCRGPQAGPGFHSNWPTGGIPRGRTGQDPTPSLQRGLTLVEGLLAARPASG